MYVKIDSKLAVDNNDFTFKASYNRVIITVLSVKSPFTSIVDLIFVHIFHPKQR